MYLYQGNVNLFLVKSITVRYRRMARQQYWLDTRACGQIAIVILSLNFHY